MVDVRPFKGLRFSHTMSGDLSDILCPPYDVISGNDQLDLYESSPYNMIRLELGKETPDDTMLRWIRNGGRGYEPPEFALRVAKLSDAAIAANILYQGYRDDLFDMLKNCYHGRYLAGIGLAADLEFCAQTNLVDVVPRQIDGRISM